MNLMIRNVIVINAITSFWSNLLTSILYYVIVCCYYYTLLILL